MHQLSLNSLIKWVRENLYGLFLIVAVGIIAEIISGSNNRLSSPVISLLIGVVLANSGVLGSWAKPSLELASGRILKIGICLLGFRLAFSEITEIGSPIGVLIVIAVVIIVFFGIQKASNIFSVNKPLALLVASGFSICGVSAIAAMKPLSGADEEETGYAVGLVTLFGSIAVLAFPIIQAIFDFDENLFGWWIGLSVHDTGQVVATASAVSENTLDSAVLVKMCRILMLAPLLMFVSFKQQKRSKNLQKWKLPIPVFILGFIAAAAIRSASVLSESFIETIGDIRNFLITMAMFGLGAGVRLRALKNLGRQPLVLGLVSWVAVLTVAGAGVLIQNQL